MTPNPWPRLKRKRIRPNKRALDRFLGQSRMALQARREGFSPTEAAAAAGISLWTLHRWLALGKSGNVKSGHDEHYREFRMLWFAADGPCATPK